jgi:glucose/arabinose dehydrogenase/PKD repeat protein
MKAAALMVAVLTACALAAPAASAQQPQFERVQLVDDSLNPFEVDIAPDGRVFYIERFGAVRIWDPDTEQVTDAGQIAVYSGEENGLLGLALAPDFEASEQLYLAYAVPPESTLTQRVSRFQLEGNALDLESEEIVYEWTHQRDECCHSAGSIEFGPDGSLYISTGDNVNPFQSQGFTPIDERPGSEAFDAQRTSANSNDANGKILRIVPNEEGPGHTIPEGNLFEPGTEDTLPEIYAMGFRNPFRFTVDPETGWVLLGDYGPDAPSGNPSRGPQGSVEYNAITEPGNYGWPYCIRENVAYIDYTFPSGPSGLPFDCDQPVNESPNNTGLTDLPPAQPATMWMGYSDTDARFPALGTGGAPMGGPRYHYDPDNPSPTKFPESYDGEWFIGEWNNSWIKTATLDGEGNATDVSNFPSLGYLRPMDMQFGPDGSLYIAEWGSNGGGNDPTSGVYRIDFVQPTGPQVTVSADPESGTVPLAVQFEGEATDPDGEPNQDFTYEWDFGDGTPTSAEEDPLHTYTEAGIFTATLTVTDPETEEQGSDSVDIQVAPDCAPEPPDPDDEFDGAALDGCRWTEIVRPVPAQLAVGDGALAIDTGNGTDMFGGTTNAENIVLQPAPEGAWEITTEVTLPFTGKDYEQAGLMVYGGDADWIKLNYIKVPENDGRQVEFTLQDDGSAIFDPSLDRSGFLDSSFPDTIHLRIRNDGTFLRAAYSEDGAAWTELGRARPLAAIPDPMVGVAAFNGDGSGNEAAFDFFNLDPLDDEPACTEPESPDPGYEMLFDGTEESFAQWQMAGPGGFNLTPDCSLESFGGLGMLYLDQAYDSPVSFRIEWMMPGDDNSGVVLGNWEPDPDYPAGPAWDALDHGYEVQLDATDDPDSTTGAIYNFQAPDATLRDEALNPPGQWNTYEITVDDPTIVVRLNGATINRFTHDPQDQPDRDISLSKLGIQNHGAGDEVYFRRIQVKEHGPGPGCDQPGGAIDPNDDFSGTELDGCRWNRIVRYDPPGLDVSGGSLNLETSYADIYGQANSDVTNMTLQEAPDGNWTAETKVTIPLVQCCQQAGLISYLDDGNYVKWDVIADPGEGQARFELRSEIDDVVQEPQTSEFVDYPEDDTYWLRLSKAGDTYAGAYSLDGEAWTDFATEVANPAIAGGAALGPFTLGVFQDAPIWASFDWFTLDAEGGADTTPPTTTIQLNGAPPAPAYDGPVEVTLEAADEDGGSGVAGTEYGLDGAGWTPYGGLFTISAEGEHTVEFRSTDVAGNLEETKSASFTIGGGGTPRLLPRLTASVFPRRMRVGPRRKQVRVRLRVTNRGNGPTGRLTLCARAPRKRLRVKGKPCRAFAGLAPGAARVQRFRLRVRPKARGKLTRIRLIANGPSVDNRQVVVRLRVRR